MLERVAQSVGRMTGSSRGGVGHTSTTGREQHAHHGEMWPSCIRPALPEYASIVLDALRLDDAIPELASLSRLVSRTPGARLIVTSREIPEEGYSALSAFHIVDPYELRFDAEEVKRLIALLGGHDDSLRSADAVLEVSMGQAALACVLAKHLVCRGEAGAWRVPSSADMASLLLSLAETQLGKQGLEVLYLLGTMGSASLLDLRAAMPNLALSVLEDIAEKIPLIRVERGHGPAATVAHMHDLAQGVFTSVRFTSRTGLDRSTRFQEAISILESRGSIARALAQLVADEASDQRLAEWILENGERAIADGARLSVSEAIDSLPTADLLEYPRLLLLAARIDADLGRLELAVTRANAARDLARNIGDGALEMAASAVIARVLIDRCQLGEALECLQVAANASGGESDVEAHSAVLSYLVAHAGLRLDAARAEAAEREASKLLRRGRPSPGVEAAFTSSIASVAIMFGDMRRSLSCYNDVLDLRPPAVDFRASALGNKATLLMELGRLDRARSVAMEGVEYAITHGLSSHRDACECALAAIEFTASADCAPLELIDAALERFAERTDRASECFTRLYLAVMRRASRQTAASMAHGDQVMECSTSMGTEYFRLMAEVELAANYLALGDVEAASSRAGKARDEAADRAAIYHLMRADMVLAEVARREGRLEEARSRLINHEEYILSDNANWSIAMYIRSFPHLLGVFAAALGAERLPILMLQMITGRHVEESLSAARRTLEDNEWHTLAFRMLGEEGADRIAALAATPMCRVRLFGGLEVAVGTRQVMERDWKKRKARLLFAMLVLQQGRDVPREQIYDHLWTEMDADRARNNFYVIWSSMKAALVPDSSKGESCPYVEHTGGVCKAVPEHVHSDVAEFEKLMSDARHLDAAGDHAGAVRAYERIADLYRGELLPGDVYDDWFSSARNHYRQEFCDAMRAAHRLLTDVGDHPGALRMIRRGLGADPWREDLYQAALRSQVASGQRSAAIDTYLTCRTNLAEQLGLDPSAETVALYQQVLAMEARPGSDD
ncbi:MAG TPA: bacterial transcriptional activator domain-containing protein [Coriobacteriia bacterium]|nr:bacterial transcriptional activator domain-containing protein [Coriobacteriia bacterium]